jgi:hypothetical protein
VLNPAVTIGDPAGYDLVFTEADAAVVSFLCHWDAGPGQQCGGSVGGVGTFTAPLPATLEDGPHSVIVEACKPGAIGCQASDLYTFAVQRGTATPPPPPPPPPTSFAPVVITIRPRTVAAASSAFPAATFGIWATNGTPPTPAPATPAVLLTVPYTELARTQLCLHGPDNASNCHSGTWWLAHLPAKD